MDSYLHLIIGPMFSGKSTKLIQLINQHSHLNTLVINHSFDKRYGNNLITHDGLFTNCVFMDTLPDTVDSAEYIFINEGQFFKNLTSAVHSLLSQNKKIFICGLNGDFMQHKFGDLIDLIPIADNIEFLTAKCIHCNLPAPFSMRTIQNTSQELIGSNDIYVPVCRKHFVLINNN